ncbi:hypothetical protein [Streptomyces violaceusniger]|uniref:hypothetical protein n=1 Tax=Streptomyces violaceusniger TaxID=68280 RepID=UPI0009C1F232|nr:hypothetical protein [Streptomyces hygroscopicus]AQW46573.1 XRE family transcriptional regulator [Streptomyces hygroscopicus]
MTSILATATDNRTAPEVTHGGHLGNYVTTPLGNYAVVDMVLGCEIGDLLIPEPQKVTRPGEENITQTAFGAAAPVPTVVPKRRDGRSLPPA